MAIQIFRPVWTRKAFKVKSRRSIIHKKTARPSAFIAMVRKKVKRNQRLACLIGWPEASGAQAKMFRKEKVRVHIPRGGIVIVLVERESRVVQWLYV